jgi:hypothetical protein
MNTEYQCWRVSIVNGFTGVMEDIPFQLREARFSFLGVHCPTNLISPVIGREVWAGMHFRPLHQDSEWNRWIWFAAGIFRCFECNSNLALSLLMVVCSTKIAMVTWELYLAGVPFWLSDGNFIIILPVDSKSGRIEIAFQEDGDRGREERRREAEKLDWWCIYL